MLQSHSQGFLSALTDLTQAGRLRLLRLAPAMLSSSRLERLARPPGWMEARLGLWLSWRLWRLVRPARPVLATTVRRL